MASQKGTPVEIKKGTKMNRNVLAFRNGGVGDGTFLNRMTTTLSNFYMGSKHVMSSVLPSATMLLQYKNHKTVVTYEK